MVERPLLVIPSASSYERVSLKRVWLRAGADFADAWNHAGKAIDALGRFTLKTAEAILRSVAYIFSKGHDGLSDPKRNDLMIVFIYVALSMLILVLAAWLRTKG